MPYIHDGTQKHEVIGPSKNSIEVSNEGYAFVEIKRSISSPVTGEVTSNIAGLDVFQTGQYTVGTSAVQLTPTPLTNRSSMSIKLKGAANTDAVYVGNSSAVTSSTGFALFDGDSLQLDLKDSQPVWVIGSNPGQTVFVMEIGG